MARPQKNNADYFSHDSSMRNDMKIKALRRKYGMNGYGLYCMLLEIIAGSDYFEYIIAEDDHIAWEMFAGDVDIDPEILREIIVYMSTLGLLHYEEGKIFSDGLKKRLQPVVEKRDRIRGSYITQKETEKPVIVTKTEQKASPTVVSATETIVPVAEMPQSKGKEIKEKEIIIKTETPKTDSVESDVIDFEKDFWSKYPKRINKKDSLRKFQSLSKTDQKLAIDGVPRYVKYWAAKATDIQFIPAPDVWINKRKWEDDLTVQPPAEYLKPVIKTETEKKAQIEKKQAEEAHRSMEELWEMYDNLSPEERNEIETQAETELEIAGVTRKQGFFELSLKSKIQKIFITRIQKSQQ